MSTPFLSPSLPLSISSSLALPLQVSLIAPLFLSLSVSMFFFLFLSLYLYPYISISLSLCSSLIVFSSLSLLLMASAYLRQKSLTFQRWEAKNASHCWNVKLFALVRKMCSNCGNVKHVKHVKLLGGFQGVSLETQKSFTCLTFLQFRAFFWGQKAKHLTFQRWEAKNASHCWNVKLFCSS